MGALLEITSGRRVGAAHDPIESALSGLSANTRTMYTLRLRTFLAWLVDSKRGFTRESAQAYLGTLTEPSVINQTLSAIKRLANEYAETGTIEWPEAIAIARIPGKRMRGTRTGHWLSAQELRSMFGTIDRSTLQGKRDAALFALLFGCGLRRAEACSLTVDHLEVTKVKEGT